MKSTFSWTSLSKTPTSSTLCFGEPTLGKLNQVKLLCSSTSSTLCDPTLAKLNHIKLPSETEFCITMHIPLCDLVVHTGTTFSVQSSSSETNRVANCHSSLVTTPSSRMILGKLKIEVTKDPIYHVGKNGEHLTKDPIYHVGKNGEHFYGENFIYEYPSKSCTKSDQHVGILHAFSKCVREPFNHGLSPSEVDWGDPKGEPTKILKHTSSGNMLMEVDWGGNLKHNYTSSGPMLMEVDWGGKLIISSMVDWGAHETHPNGHNISEIDWGGHGSSSNHMTELLLSEGDSGAHDSSFFRFLVNFDYDANPMEFFTQELWGELQQTMSSTPLIRHMTDSLDTGQTEDDSFNPKPIDPELDDPEQLSGESIQPYLSLVRQLHWLVTMGRLVTHAQVTTLPMFRSTPRKLQRIYVFLKKTIDFHFNPSNHYLSEILSKHWDLIKILPMITNLLMTYGSTPFDPKVNIYGNTHGTLTNGLSTTPHSSSHHLHTKLHISIYYYACKHKNMSHPPQEGSNISLAYCTLLGVLWQMCHAWITYGMVRRNVQMMGKLGGTSGKYQETCIFTCFWDPYDILPMLGLPMRMFVGLL